MELVQAVEAIVKVLTEGDSAVVVAGLLTVPVAHLVRSIGKQWAWWRKKIRGLYLVGIVGLISTGMTYLWSIAPGVSAPFSISAAVVATISAIVSNELWKAAKKTPSPV